MCNNLTRSQYTSPHSEEISIIGPVSLLSASGDLEQTATLEDFAPIDLFGII